AATPRTSCTNAPVALPNVNEATSALVVVVPFAMAGAPSGDTWSTPVHDAAPHAASAGAVRVTTMSAVPVGGATSCQSSTRTLPAFVSVAADVSGAPPYVTPVTLAPAVLSTLTPTSNSRSAPAPVVCDHVKVLPLPVGHWETASFTGGAAWPVLP